MIVNISTTYYPATDLGYLLHKHPDKLKTIQTGFGDIHVFFSEKSAERSAICVLLDIDPVKIVRGNGVNSGSDFALQHYINDRPYIVSSYMSVAISKAFSTALNGNCKEKPELTEKKLPFVVTVPVLPAPAGGDVLIKKIFEPLGYKLEITGLQLDAKYPEWGESKYFSVKLQNELTTKELLSHLYVLFPVLDADKHYYIDAAEADKLLKKGEGWLRDHPAREEIIKRYLINLKSLYRPTLERISEDETKREEIETLDEEPGGSVANESKKNFQRLQELRINKAVEILLASGASRVLDLGCGSGCLIKELLKHAKFTEIAGMDVSYNELLRAKERLHYENMPQKQKDRVKLFQSSLTYRDKRLTGYDAAAVLEVIEHLDPQRLKTFEKMLFGFVKPNVIIISTPNREYNAKYEKLTTGKMRHSDHRFEWTKSEFMLWAENICAGYGYLVRFDGAGEADEAAGSPTQIAVFENGN